MPLVLLCGLQRTFTYIVSGFKFHTLLRKQGSIWLAISHKMEKKEAGDLPKATTW